MASKISSSEHPWSFSSWIVLFIKSSVMPAVYCFLKHANFPGNELQRKSVVVIQQKNPTSLSGVFPEIDRMQPIMKQHYELS